MTHPYEDLIETAVSHLGESHRTDVQNLVEDAAVIAADTFEDRILSRIEVNSIKVPVEISLFRREFSGRFVSDYLLGDEAARAAFISDAEDYAEPIMAAEVVQHVLDRKFQQAVPLAESLERIQRQRKAREGE